MKLITLVYLFYTFIQPDFVKIVVEKSRKPIIDSTILLSQEELIKNIQLAHDPNRIWKTVYSLSFDHVNIHGEKADLQFWLANEMTLLSTWEYYSDWPYDNCQIVFDGGKVWSKNWKRGNPPKMIVNNHFFQYALPFLLDHPLFEISKYELIKLPSKDDLYYAIRVGLPKALGNAPEKYFKIIVDPKSFIMVAWEYNIADGEMLDRMKQPSNIKSIDNYLSIVQEHVIKDGMLLPSKYYTLNPKGDISGNHLIWNYQMNNKVDKQRFLINEKFVVDVTKYIR